jgi:hypothetical protein
MKGTMVLVPTDFLPASFDAPAVLTVHARPQ